MKPKLGEESLTPVVEPFGGPSKPRRLVLTPLDAGPSDINAMVTTFDAPGDFINWLIAHGERCSLFQIAQLLAILAIDEREQILQASFMPSRSAHAVMFRNGDLRHSRGRTFAPWIQSEIGRLASVLLANDHSYVHAVKNVLSQKKVRGFDALPADFILQDPHRSCKLAPRGPTLQVDLSGSPSANGMPWWQVIQLDYSRDRYMRHLTREQLGRRMNDIMSNIHVIDDQDRIAFDATDPALWYWQAKTAEIASEMGHRYGQYPAGWNGLLACAEWTKSLRIDDWRFSGPLSKPAKLTRPYLVKYEDRKYLEPMLRDGAIRLSPASRYADPSLNPAIRDDELSAELDVAPLNMAGFGGLPGSIAARSVHRNSVVKRFETNYYVFCTTTRLQTRLAHDFQRDAAMVIHDPQEFYARLERAVKHQLGDWRMISNNVEYYDPMNVNEREVDVLTWKHFRYAYQHETRAAWLPPKPRQELEALDLKLGPLHDICELVSPTSVARVA